MLKKVSEAFSRFKLPQNVGHIIVALSGGADSVALLYALLELKDTLGFEKISAAHFNHQIRGDEALRDQNFVTDLCKSLGVELKIGCADVPRYASEHNLSLELAARKLRYDFFETINADYIATAHTASDNVETVIFNTARGTALSGLCGIPPMRDRYIRPLILCTRDDVEQYCAGHNVDFVTDSTNLCDDYTRNKIRHNVVPVLKSFNHSVETAVARMTASLREDEDFINGITAQEYDNLVSDKGVSAKVADLHPAVAKRIIARYCVNMGIDVDNFHINAIYDVCVLGGKTSLPQRRDAYISNGYLIIGSDTEKLEKKSFSVDIQRKNNDLFKKGENVHNLLLKNVLDCDKIIGNLELGVRSTGDTIRLKNKNCTKTLKKLYCEYKIPLDERDNLPVLRDNEGIVWIYKIGVADRCAADSDTQNIYTISAKEN